MPTQRFAGTLGALALLAIGFAIGVAADRVLVAHGEPLHRAAETGTGTHEQALAFLEDELDLDVSQRRQVHEIFLRHQTIVVESWEAVQPHLQTAIESVHTQLEAVLRPDQRERFRRWAASQAVRHMVPEPGGADGH